MDIYEVLRRPVITEKNTLLSRQNKYTFAVAQDANKIMVTEAVQKLFSVKVTKVAIINVNGKSRRSLGKRTRVLGRTSDWKKAVVTIDQASQQINDFFGLA
jgi:large subunit ribosomal protein L23